MSDLLKQLSKQLAEGKTAEIAKVLRRINLKTVKRSEAFPIASIARRIDEPMIALRILNPLVRPTQGRPVRANEDEKSVYAGALIKIGGINEAIDILSSMDSIQVPMSALFLAHAYMAQWNYKDCIPILKNYLGNQSLDLERRLVGLVNLAASLIYEKEYASAEKILGSLLEESKNTFPLLFGNSLELSAQLEVKRKNWKEARAFLRQAERIFQHVSGLDPFYVRKWTALVDLLENPSTSQVVRLNEVRTEAVNRRHWETIRDCDLHLAVVKRKRHLLTHLYFGTPYDSFRQRIFLDYGGPIQMPDRYILAEPVEAKPNKEINLIEEILASKRSSNTLSKQLACILVSDFYRPLRVASLFSQLYPGEYYNPDSSPRRVYTLIQNFRKACLQEGNQIQLVSLQDDGYQLKIPKGIGIVIHHPRRAVSTDKKGIIEGLRNRFGTDPFNIRLATEGLNLSKSSFVRAMNSAIETGVIHKEGAGKGTTYRFMKRASSN